MQAEQITTGYSRWKNALASVFIVAFLIPNLVALVIPYEEFPYTSAPMFAHYVDDNTPRYRFRFVAEGLAGQQEQEIHAQDLGLKGVEFTRYFFGSVYGSTDPLSPFGHHEQDSREAFEARLSTFFNAAVPVLQQRDTATWQHLSRIRLDVARLNRDNRDTEIHTVGQYDVTAGRFTHTWGGTQ